MAESNLAVDFWLDVERQLQLEFGMPVDRAREALDAYRRRMASVGAIDTVYHWGPRDIARAINGGRYAEEPTRS
jgi:hypothetical protein